MSLRSILLTLWQQNPKIQHHYYQSLPLDMILSQFHPSPILTTYFPKIHLTNTVAAEPEGSTPLIPKLATGHDPVSISSISHLYIHLDLHLLFGFPSNFSPRSFTPEFCIFVSPILGTFPAQHSILGFITLIILDNLYKS
jgi:hypothetical protein